MLPEELLKNVLDVVIDTPNSGKFIVAEVRINDTKKLVVRALKNCKYHFDIETKLRAEVRSLGMMAWCIGGGKYRIDNDRKTLLIWSESGEFGREPDRNKTVEMLQRAFPEFTIITPDNLTALTMGLEL